MVQYKYNQELKQIKIKTLVNNMHNIITLSEEALIFIVNGLYPDNHIQLHEISHVIDCIYDDDHKKGAIYYKEVNGLIDMRLDFNILFFKDTTGITFSSGVKYYGIGEYMCNVYVKTVREINYI